ncbi:UNVERIFIED_CONTAM: hypothetical protein Scaly_2441300 [Sesamum calycinum]|uniref:Uncharacterized protein n=1 Tax=Sesamum calycinum TaxID=2727403 RepID=A0AAW2M137_9LAMI
MIHVLDVQSLEEIVASVDENPIEDESEDDTMPLQQITQREAFIAATTFCNFLLQYENATPEILDTAVLHRNIVRVVLTKRGFDEWEIYYIDNPVVGPSTYNQQDDKPEADNFLNNKQMDSEPDVVEVEGQIDNNPKIDDDVNIPIMMDVFEVRATSIDISTGDWGNFYDSNTEELAFGMVFKRPLYPSSLPFSKKEKHSNRYLRKAVKSVNYKLTISESSSSSTKGVGVTMRRMSKKLKKSSQMSHLTEYVEKNLCLPSYARESDANKSPSSSSRSMSSYSFTTNVAPVVVTNATTIEEQLASLTRVIEGLTKHV